MKKFLYVAFSCSLFSLVACGDGAGTDETSDMDTSTAMTDNSTAAANSVMTKTLDLSSSQEVPANNSAAKGTVDVTYNKDSKTLSYTVKYSDLTDKASMAHIHGTAAMVENAGVKVDIKPKLEK